MMKILLEGNLIGYDIASYAIANDYLNNAYFNGFPGSHPANFLSSMIK